MKRLIDNLNIYYGENVRLVKDLAKREKNDDFPEQMKWAVQLLYFDGIEWIQICRIDNFPHEGKSGSHIHQYKKEETLSKSLSFQEAEDEIKKIGKRIILEQYGEIIEFGVENEY